MKEWNLTLLTTLFGTQKANIVANIPISNENGDDILV
jgi:hypothetical protein